MTTIAQRSFAGGEISPSVYPRVDTVKYSTGARQLRNHIIKKEGGIQNRPGFSFVDFVRIDKSRVIDFVFSGQQARALLFRNYSMQVYANGEPLTFGPQVISNISKGSVTELTVTGHNVSFPVVVIIKGAKGIPELNGYFLVTAEDANTLRLRPINNPSGDVDSTSWGTYYGGGTTNYIVAASSPYSKEHLKELQYTQSGDKMIFVHPLYPPQELSRISDTTWEFKQINFGPGIDSPMFYYAESLNPGSTHNNRYQATAVSESGEESLPAHTPHIVISAISKGSPTEFTTATSHGLVTNDEVVITTEGFPVNPDLFPDGMDTHFGNKRFLVIVTDPDKFTIAVDSTGFDDYSANTMNVYKDIVTIGSTTALGPSNPNTIDLTRLGHNSNVPGAVAYNIYRESNGVFGYIGQSKFNTNMTLARFVDLGTTPDIADSPPIEKAVFNGVGEYPSTVAFYQQRLGFANSTNRPETVWLSRIGSYYNFSISSPTQSDDSIEFTLAGNRIQEVQNLVSVEKLLILASGGEFSSEGGVGGSITPTDINIKQYSYNGAKKLRPVIIGSNVVFVQNRGASVRDLGFEWQSDGYNGSDVSIFSRHLFEGFEIVDIAYQQAPNSIIWLLRNDGVLVGLTYIREHQIWGWHRHDTDGFIESICCIPEGDEDFLYATIKRGSDIRLERLNTRFYKNPVDGVFMDSAMSYDGRNYTDTTMTVSGGTDWDEEETLILTSSTSFFVPTDVGNEIHLGSPDGDFVRLQITAYTSATEVSVIPHKTVPESFRGEATKNWSKAVDELYGLSPLEGKQVSIFADGYVVASPNNNSYEPMVVEDGYLELDKCYAVIHVGLPYMSDLETLDIDSASGETLADKKKVISKAVLWIDESRGIFIGYRQPKGNDPLENMYEPKVKSDEGYEEHVRNKSGVIEVNIKAEWNSNGRIFVRQVDPLPLSILAIAPGGVVGGG